MGVLLGKFAKTENKGRSAEKQARPSFFGSRKTIPVHIKVDQAFDSSNGGRNLKIIDSMKLNGILVSHQDESVTTPSVGWNFEDEYKSFIQKSIKKKSGSDNVSNYKRKLRKICKEQSDLCHSLACDVPIDKIQISSKTSKRDFSGMNGILSLDRLHEISPDSMRLAPDTCIQLGHNKSLEIQNTKTKIRTRSRSNSTNNGNNKKLKNLQLIQLTSEPVVVLNGTIVSEYLKAKRIIDRIMRPQNKK